MSDYLLLFRGGDAKTMRKTHEKWQEHMQKWMTWMGSLNEQGKFVSAQPLAESGKTITGNKKIVSDGPFMEGKEMVGGYLICKANDYTEALEISQGCPILEFDDGVVEVREIQELSM